MVPIFAFMVRTWRPARRVNGIDHFHTLVEAKLDVDSGAAVQRK